MTRATLTAVGALASVTGIAMAQHGDLRRLTQGHEITPVRIARAVAGPAGPERTGDWMPYEPAASHRAGEMVFDCYVQSGDCTGGYLFPKESNLFWTNDMTLAHDTIIENGASRADIAWFWGAGGTFTSESCIIAIFTQESVPCDPDSFDYEGWMIDFGTLPSSWGAGYYYSNIDLGADAWALPATGAGSYATYYLQAAGDDEAPATSAAPAYWATGEDRGDPGAPGTQGPLEFNDDVIPDGSHTSSECYSYDMPDCPAEIGPAIAFWGDRGDGCLGLFPNCNGDTEVNTQDFLCFLTKWSAAYQSGDYDPDADCDGDGSVNTQDFVCFLNKFAGCFG